MQVDYIIFALPFQVNKAVLQNICFFKKVGLGMIISLEYLQVKRHIGIFLLTSLSKSKTSDFLSREHQLVISTLRFKKRGQQSPYSVCRLSLCLPSLSAPFSVQIIKLCLQ